jgi:polysaccharide biosynthesis transport protein
MDPAKPTPQASGADNRLHFLDYWRIIRIRKTVILAVFLLVVVTTTAVTLMLRPSYMSMVRMSVEKSAADISPLGGGQRGDPFDPYFIQTEFEKIRSRSVLYPVITNSEFNLNQRFGERYGNGQPLTTSESYRILSSMIDVNQTRNTSLIEIRVYSNAEENAAQEAADIANKIAEVYRETRIELRQALARRGIDTLTNELAKQEVEVVRLQAELDELKKELGISESIVEGGSLVQLVEPETVRRMEAERIAAEAQFTGLNELLTQLQAMQARGGGELRKAILNAYPDNELGKLLSDLWYTEAAFAKQNAVYGPEHPEVRQYTAMLQTINKNVDDRIEGIMKGLRLRVDAKFAELNALQDAVRNARQMEAEATERYRPYFIKRRDLENVQRMRDLILLRVLQEQTDLAIPTSGIVEITDRAEADTKPVRPNIPLNLALGVIVGLVVGVGLAFFIEYLDTSVKTIDDVERALGSPVLGVIPQNVGSLIEEGPESPHAEAYRVLRTNILFSRKREDANSLTVVSGGAGEGKSTTIFNLCSVFAQNNQRVLLVDSDLRRPSLHKLFKVSNSTGLTSLLLGHSKIEEVIQTTPQTNLDFLPSGKLPSSSLGILNSPQMKEFIQEVKRRYDWVFFDSPPIMGVSDASVLTSMVDVTLLVIQYRKYPQAMTVRAKQMVEKIGGNLLGVVLNNINISQDSYYYYYSGYYYDYYSKREDSGSDSDKNGQKRSSRSSRSSPPAASETEIKQKY